MKAAINLKPVLEFLADLLENNNKAWFDKNRARYEQAREAFEYLVDYIISELDENNEFAGVSAKDCIFRINRDIRFSKDKTPYKTNFGAEITAGGRKSGMLGYYVHLAPHDGSLIAGGLYMPTSGQLAKFRETIARDAGPFKRITRTKEFLRYFGPIDGDRLTTSPQGYSRDHPEIDLLRLKQVTVGYRLKDRQVLSRSFPGQALKVMKAMRPFNEYMNRILI